MSQSVGRSVRLFLVDGSPLGLVTAEVMNWTGHILTAPRSGLAKFLSRPELDRTGIYFLFGHALDDADNLIVYIGESDNVRKRLAQHNKDDSKSFWERTCVVTSKDQNITKAHARYLESRLIAIGHEAARTAIANATTPPLMALPEADQSDMEYFIQQIRLVLPVLGFEFLRGKPRRSTLASERRMQDDPALNIVFEIVREKYAIKAQAAEIDGEFVVLSGSLAVGSWKQPGNASHSYRKLYEKLKAQGKLIPQANTELLCFAEDTSFSSPSAASAIILGRADNGRTSWRVKGQTTTYADWQEQQVAQITPAPERESGPR